ncbi:unnamed protein product [Urochloa humidicola]
MSDRLLQPLSSHGTHQSALRLSLCPDNLVSGYSSYMILVPSFLYFLLRTCKRDGTLKWKCGVWAEKG